MLLLLLVTSLAFHTSEGYEDGYLAYQNISTDNWTTCEEFLNNTTFEVDSVIDVDWMIFYYWSSHPERSYHVRFSSPSSVLVDRFRLELNNDIVPRVNWSHADLFIETSIDLSGLFIRTNMSGKFRFIPSFSFQFHFTPYLEFALKVVDGFLSMMNCQQKLAYALAPVQNVPNPLEIEKVAAIFEIRNPLGQSYLTKNVFDPPAAALQRSDADDDPQEEFRDPMVNMIF